MYHSYLCQSDYQTAKEFELSNVVEMIHKQERSQPVSPDIFAEYIRARCTRPQIIANMSQVSFLAYIGNSDALYVLGVLHAYGSDEVNRNGNLAFQFMLKAAEFGHKDARKLMAIHMLKGSFDETEVTRSREWLKTLAENGDMEAIFIMFCHCIGSDEAIDWEKLGQKTNMVLWSKLITQLREHTFNAVAEGSAEGQRGLGLMLIYGICGFSKNEEQGIVLLKKAALQRDEIAIEFLKQINKNDE